MAILILQERGKLNISDPMRNHYPAAPEAWKEITIHHLLTHTSGIMHSWNLPGWRETMMVPASLDEVLNRFHDKPLLSTPGEKFHYSGVGYFALARIIENLSGKSYEEFLRSEIFEPIGMKDTGADRADLLLDNRASGYVRGENGLRNSPWIHMRILTGGGNLYSTVEDLARWDQALRNRKFIPQYAYKAMYKPNLNNYAYGWSVKQWDGYKTISHGGGVPGFSAFILRIPDEALCIVVTSNVTPTPAQRIANALAAIALAL
jgi:CubicO group peptidase (beta-lactamase class C family)